MSASVLVRDVQQLLTKYTSDEIVKAMNFIASLNTEVPEKVESVDTSMTKIKNMSVDDKVFPDFVLLGYPWYMTINTNTIREVNEFVLAGQKIGAIKALRAATGLGLKEAKDLVETRFY